MSKIRVGIIGVGWGALVHIPGFRAVEDFEVVALCSRRAESVNEAGARHGITDCSTNWEDFVRRDDLDLISITVPQRDHVRMALAALDAGKHVLLEKPVAMNSAEAKEAVDAAEQSKLATAVCFEKRWYPTSFTMWQLVESGFIGEPYFVRVCERADYWHPSHAPQHPWVYRRDEGGGYLANAQSHQLDYVLRLLGEPEAVCADLKSSVPQRRMADGAMLDVDAEDTSNVILRLKSGARAMLSCSVVGALTGELGSAVEIFGSKGTLVLGWDGQLTGGQVGGKLGPIELLPQPLKSGVLAGSRRSTKRAWELAHLLEAWLPSIRGTGLSPNVPSFREGWMVQRVIDSAIASSDGAGWVSLS